MIPKERSQEVDKNEIKENGMKKQIKEEKREEREEEEGEQRRKKKKGRYIIRHRNPMIKIDEED